MVRIVIRRISNMVIWRISNAAVANQRRCIYAAMHTPMDGALVCGPWMCQEFQRVIFELHALRSP